MHMLDVNMKCSHKHNRNDNSSGKLDQKKKIRDPFNL